MIGDDAKKVGTQVGYPLYCTTCTEFVQSDGTTRFPMVENPKTIKVSGYNLNLIAFPEPSQHVLFNGVSYKGVWGEVKKLSTFYILLVWRDMAFLLVWPHANFTPHPPSGTILFPFACRSFLLQIDNPTPHIALPTQLSRLQLGIITKNNIGHNRVSVWHVEMGLGGNAIVCYDAMVELK